jgi:Fic family protein
MRRKYVQVYSKIWDTVNLHGGLTCDELIQITGLLHQTASARMGELVKDGYLVDSGVKRKTRSGYPARVVIIGKTYENHSTF